MRVLIVDDDEEIRFTLRMVLEDEGYAVLEVGDGLAALDLLYRIPDRLVVLLDVMMPRLDGIGVLRAVRGEPDLAARHAYLLLTASHQARDPDIAPLLNELAIPVIAKPFTLTHIASLVAQAAARLT